MVPFTQSVSKEGASLGCLPDWLSLSQLVRKELTWLPSRLAFTQSVGKEGALPGCLPDWLSLSQ